jgi:hypothetical protein
MQTKIWPILLMVIGVLMILYTGFNYVTTKKLVAVGNLQINQVNHHPVEWSPIVGGIFLVLGLLLFVRIQKKG